MVIKRTESFVDQVVEEIKERIESGEYALGQRIPSENELSTELSISRATIRSAYIKLSTEGVLRRVHGDGTYIRKRIPDLISAQEGVWDFSKLIEHQGYQPSIKGLRITERLPNESESRALDIDADDRVVSVRRVIYADQNPVFYSQNVYSANLFDQNIEELDLSLGLNEFTKQYTDQELVSVLMTISAGKGELGIEDINNKKTADSDDSIWIKLEEIFYDTNEVPLVYAVTHVQNMILPIWIGLKGFDK
jgi:DNA-binding GntR family transcriptional regulator